MPSIDPTSSILFLGSGFTLGAENQFGESPPNGSAFKLWVEEKLGFDTPTPYDLRVLSDELIARDQRAFASDLKRIFRVRRITDVQSAILEQNWRRIYTTNYDDAAELHFVSKGQIVPSFDLADDYPVKLPQQAIIHLHGSVRKIGEDNLRSSVVLGERSYVDQMLHESRWYDQFLRDIAFADHVFFVGYSLSDYLISSLLNQNPQISQKTTFVVKGPTDLIERNRISPYGSIEEVGTEGFAKWLSTIPRSPPASDVKTLKAFRPLNPSRDRKALQDATAPEVFDMLVYGNFDPGRLASSLPRRSYVATRQHDIEEAFSSLQTSRTLLVDSRIGNGKTVFLHLLAARLATEGYNPFLFRPGHPSLNQEVAALTKLEKVVIFFERYGDAEDALPSLATNLPDAKFVAEIRTALFEVRFHDLKKVTGGEFKRVGINNLSSEDEDAILNLAKRAGIPVGERRGNSFGELRYVLLDVFKNQSVKESIRKQLLPLFSNSNLKRILACAALLGRNHTKFGLELLRAIYRFDPFVELRDTDGLSAEIFEFDADGFRIRSALLSEYLIKEYLDPDEVADAATRLIKYSADRRDLRIYRALMGELMAFGNLFPVFGADEHAVKRIVGFYEDLRHDDRINDEPLFWLQFAIASVEDNRLDLAISYLETAYERAKDIDGFQTYQIDTQAFRVYLLSDAANENGEDSAVGRILELFGLVEDMLREDSHRIHAVKVLENVRPYILQRSSSLTEGERIAFVFRMNSVAQTLRALPVDFRVRTGAEAIATQLAEAATVASKR